MSDEFRTYTSADNRDQRSYLAWCSLWMNGQGVLDLSDSGPFHIIDDNELPGMWERADFEGGLDEVRR